MVNAVFFWLIVSVALCAVELISPGLFFFLSFALSAAVMAGISLVAFTAPTQIILFFAISGFAFLLLSRLVRTHRNQVEATNVDAYRGKQVFVAAVSPQVRKMYIQVGSERWVARFENNNDTAVVGTPVEIIRVQGCHMVIRTINKYEKGLL